VNDLISKAAENDVGHQEAMVPLIRVRVDYTGFTTINPQRFGQKFVGKVANPHDILLFTKAAKKRASTDGILLTLVFLLFFEEPFELSLGLINRVIPCP
jgi:double-strand break repair protein MRE11